MKNENYNIPIGSYADKIIELSKDYIDIIDAYTLAVLITYNEAVSNFDDGMKFLIERIEDFPSYDIHMQEIFNIINNMKEALDLSNERKIEVSKHFEDFKNSTEKLFNKHKNYYINLLMVVFKDELFKSMKCRDIDIDKKRKLFKLMYSCSEKDSKNLFELYEKFKGLNSICEHFDVIFINDTEE